MPDNRTYADRKASAIRKARNPGQPSPAQIRQAARARNAKAIKASRDETNPYLLTLYSEYDAANAALSAAYSSRINLARQYRENPCDFMADVVASASADLKAKQAAADAAADKINRALLAHYTL